MHPPSPRQPVALIVGCGDLGTRLAMHLAATGHAVFGLRRNGQLIPPPIRAVSGDAADPASYRSLPAHLDLLAYTAAAPAPGDEAAYRRTYIDGPRAMLDALAMRGLRPSRVLFTSSTSVYGQADGSLVDEDSETTPDGFRGRVLLEAETAFLRSGFPACVLRLSGIYGPGRTHLLDGVRQGRIGLSSDGVSPWTNRIHVDDAARALAHLAALPDPAPLYLGTDMEPARRDDVVRWIAARLRIEPACGAAIAARGGDKRCSNARLLRSGFRFRYESFREGYAELLPHAPEP